MTPGLERGLDVEYSLRRVLFDGGGGGGYPAGGVIDADTDSRVYLLQENKLQRVSKDHSLVAEMVAEGKIQPDDIYTHVYQDFVTHVVTGLERNIEGRFVPGLVEADHGNIAVVVPLQEELPCIAGPHGQFPMQVGQGDIVIDYPELIHQWIAVVVYKEIGIINDGVAGLQVIGDGGKIKKYSVGYDERMNRRNEK